MSSLSRLGSKSTGLVAQLAAKTALPLVPVRFAGGAGYRVRPGVFAFNRAKDATHFYLALVGIPLTVVGLGQYYIMGPCELRDIPETGDYPRYWQFERTPIKQFTAKYLRGSDLSYADRMLGYHYYEVEKTTHRKMVNRVKHLMIERMDYKGYGYVPAKSEWVERSERQHRRAAQGGDLFISHVSPTM